MAGVEENNSEQMTETEIREYAERAATDAVNEYYEMMQVGGGLIFGIEELRSSVEARILKQFGLKP